MCLKQFMGSFGRWSVLVMGRFRLSDGPFWIVAVDRFGLAMGRFGHTENLWAILVGPFWFMGRFGRFPCRGKDEVMIM